MPGTVNEVRYFLAVWPDAEVRTALEHWAASIRVDPPARPVPGRNLHITLAFLGPLESPAVEAVRSAAGSAKWSGTSLVLDRIGYWRRSRIIWAGSRAGSDALAVLAGDLADRLRRIGFRIEEHSFVPHVTLFRKARRRPRWRRCSVTWRIDGYSLVASRLSADGADYEVIAHWSAHDDVK